MSLLRAVATVGGFTMMSRVLGFVRDVIVAAVLGAGPLADAFFVAFKLPNFLRRLFAEGAFNAGFVPLFARTLEGEGREEAKRFAEEAQAVQLTVLLIVVLAAWLFMPAVIRVLAPGFDPDSVQYGAVVEMTRITMPYILFISLVALQSGVLNSLGRFAPPAASPIVLNITLIAAATVFLPLFENAAYALAWGVFAAGVLQWIWLAYSCHRAGLSIGLRWPRITDRVKRLFALILPGVVGAGAAQFNLIMNDVVFASFLPAGSISWLYYADRLNQLPLGVIGVAVGTALLPLLSRQLKAGDAQGAAHSLNRGIETALLLTLPAAVALIVLATPIIGTLFERGAFGPEDTHQSARALHMFALGLPAFVLIKVLAPGFFAREDTVTPVRIAIACMLANVVIAFILIWPLKHVGLALATSISNWVNALLLGIFLYRRGFLSSDARLHRFLPRLLAACAIMGIALVPLPGLSAQLPDIISLAITIALGGAVFFVSAHLLGVVSLADLRRRLRRSAS